MLGQKNRYFIELQPNNTQPVPRYLETEIRRKLATEFIQAIHEWLKDQDMENRVYAMAITALGQVQITCDPEILHQIRNQEIMEIASVRQGSLLNEKFSRFSEPRVQSL